MTNKKRATIALLLISLIIQVFSFSAFAIEGSTQGGAGHEYDNVDLDALNKPQEKVETELIELTKSFSDITDATLLKYAELLNAVGIVNGYEDGTFREKNSITRGEISAILIRMLNYDAEVLGSLQASFYDIDASHQFYDVISACVNLGIIKGYDDNTFRSENTITYNELIAMTVRSLGYNELAEVKGGYPGGYLIVANDIGLLSGVTCADKNAVTRGEAATVIYRALHTPILKKTGYGEDVTTDSDRNTTILTENHNIYKSTGVVKANSVTSLNNISATDETLVIGTERFEDENSRFSNYLGYKVDYYYYNDNDMKKVVFMTKNSTVEELVITADAITNYANLTYTYEISEDKTKTATINSIHDLILNGRRAIIYDENVFDIPNGLVRLVSNEGELTYDTVIIETYENYILKGITGDTSTVKLTLEYDYQPIEIDIQNTTKLDIVDSNGAPISYIATIAGLFDADGNPQKTTDFSKVPTDVVISVYADVYGTIQRGHRLPADNAQYIKVVISEKTLTGTVDSYNSITEVDPVTSAMTEVWDTITIDGKKYEFSTSNFMNEDACKCKLGDAGTFYLDTYGKIVAFEKGEATDGEFEYGYLITADTAGEIDGVLEAKIMNTQNDKIIYKCTDPVFINDDRCSGAAAKSALSTSAKYVNPTFNMSQVIKFKTNEEGVITHIQTALQSVGLPSGVDSDHLKREETPKTYYVEHDTYGRMRLQLNTEVDGVNVGAWLNNIGMYFQPATYFTVPRTEEFVDDDTMYKVGGVTTYGNKEVELYDADYLRPNLAVIYETVTAGDITTTSYKSAVMVKEVTNGVDEDGFGASKIKVITGLAEKEYIGQSSDTFIDPDTNEELKPGDMIILETMGKDIVSGWRYATFNGNEITAANVAAGIFHPLVDTWQSYAYETGAFAIDSIAEPYITLPSRSNQIVFQAGPVVDETTNVRANWFTGHMNTNSAWQHGGAIICDATKSMDKPVVRVAGIADFKSVHTDGAENASLVFFNAENGGARVYVIYNGYNNTTRED